MEYNEKGGGAFPNQETNSDGSWSWKEGSLSWCILLDILPQKRIGVVKICCNPINICWNLHDTSMFRPWKSMVAKKKKKKRKKNEISFLGWPIFSGAISLSGSVTPSIPYPSRPTCVRRLWSRLSGRGVSCIDGGAFDCSDWLWCGGQNHQDVFHVGA